VRLFRREGPQKKRSGELCLGVLCNSQDGKAVWVLKEKKAWRPERIRGGGRSQGGEGSLNNGKRRGQHIIARRGGSGKSVFSYGKKKKGDPVGNRSTHLPRG